MADTSRARMLQIAAECLVKSAHIILTSRIYHSSRTLSLKGPKCWFNLDVEELDIAQRELDHWRRDPLCPMIIEVFVQPWTRRSTVQQVNVQVGDASQGRRLVERWTLSYVASEAQHGQQGRSSASRLEPAAVYKRMVIAMRSLFSYVRVLPTYRLYKACAQERGGSMALQYCITRGAPGVGSAGACPARMEHFAFAPVETQHGSFRMTVDYAPSSTVAVLKDSTSHAPMAQIIADYAGDIRSNVASTLSASMHAPAGAPPPRHLEPSPSHAVPSASGQPPAEPALRRRSWSLQGAASTLVPNVALGMSPPTVVVSGSSAATRAASQDMGGFRRLSVRGGQAETDEPSAGAPTLTHAWSTPPKYPGTPTSPGFPGSSGAVQTWSRAAANQEAHARTQQAASSRRSLEVRSQSKPAAGGSRLQSMAENAASSGSRQTSAPVSIPGASDTTARHSRTHSSGDLAAMQQHDTTTQVRTVRWMSGQPRVPASAPAASAASASGQGPPRQPMERPSARTTGFVPATSPHMPLGSPLGSLGQAGPSRSCLKRPDGSSAPEERRLSFAGGSVLSAAQQPPTPPALYTAHPMGSESSGSAASSFPASCSPQLPFAFTPSGVSFSSVHDPAAQAATAAAAGNSEAAAQASSPAQAHALTVFRRPMLGASPRLSSAFELPAVVGALGYSLSPVQGSLESSLLSASTPRHTGPLPIKLPLPFPPSSQGAAVLAPGFTVGSGPPRLTYPVSGQALDLPELPSHSATEDAETEMLPFALDSDAMPASPQPLAPLRARGSGLPPADLDDAVGAFVRVIQEAPAELRQGGGPEQGERSRMTLQGGLAQLSSLKAQLEAM